MIHSWTFSLCPIIDTKLHPQEPIITDGAIWIRISYLPTNFYDRSILERVGSKLSDLLKVDTCTSAALCRSYARICIQVSIGVPVTRKLIIEDYVKEVIYERKVYISLVVTILVRF